MKGFGCESAGQCCLMMFFSNAVKGRGHAGREPGLRSDFDL